MKVSCFVISLLLCSQLSAQGRPSSNKPSPPKSAARTKISTPAPTVEPAAISKEFTQAARKSFQTLERLRDRFWEDLDNDVAWTPREVEAENARDALEMVANTPLERSLFYKLKTNLLFIHSYRSQVKVADRISKMQGKYAIYEAQVEATEKGLKNLFEGVCYLPTKEMATTGAVKDIPEQCKPSSGKENTSGQEQTPPK